MIWLVRPTTDQNVEIRPATPIEFDTQILSTYYIAIKYDYLQKGQFPCTNLIADFVVLEFPQKCDSDIVCIVLLINWINIFRVNRIVNPYTA